MNNVPKRKKARNSHTRPLYDHMATYPAMLQGMRESREEDWKEFYLKYWTWLVSHAKNELRTHSEAEDMAQKVLIKVNRAMPTFEYDPEKSFRGWLLTILKNEVLTLARKNGRSPLTQVQRHPNDSRKTEPIARIPAPPPNGWPDQNGREHLQELITESLTELKEKVTANAFEMFRLQHFEDREIEDIVMDLARTPNAIYSSNSRTMSAFRRIFKKRLRR